MYDTLTTSYTFNCPIHGETHVRLSRFRRLEQLPGAQHPALFRVEFDCGCGEAHPGLLAPDVSGDRVGLAVRCPSCGKVSVNLVSRAHVDVPFVNDREVGVVQHLFEDDAQATVAEFHAELWSGSFDARR